VCIEFLHSHGQRPCKFIRTTEKVYTKQEFHSHNIGLVHQHCGHFTILVLINMAAATSCENTLSPGQVVVLMPPQALLDITSPGNIG